MVPLRLLVYAAGIGPQTLALCTARRPEITPLGRAVQSNWSGLDHPLQPPEAAIPPEEDAVSIAAAMAMRGAFAQNSSTLLARFDALVELLTGGARKH